MELKDWHRYHRASLVITWLFYSLFLPTVAPLLPVWWPKWFSSVRCSPSAQSSVGLGTIFHMCQSICLYVMYVSVYDFRWPHFLGLCLFRGVCIFTCSLLIALPLDCFIHFNPCPFVLHYWINLLHKALPLVSAFYATSSHDKPLLCIEF